MSLQQLAAEMRVWADENCIPNSTRIRIWAGTIAAYAAPHFSEEAADIIAVINAAATPEEALAAYRDARATVIGLSLWDRLLIVENLIVQQARAIEDWAK